MPKHRIFTVGFYLPGGFEEIQFESNRTLLDADIILYKPTLYLGPNRTAYSGLPVVDESDGFVLSGYLDHWKSEIAAAVRARKLVIVFLAKPIECYEYDQDLQLISIDKPSPLGLDTISSYNAIDYFNWTSKTGDGIKLTKEGSFLNSYWSQFRDYTSYEVEIKGRFKQKLFTSLHGDRTLGASTNIGEGTLLFLPSLNFDSDVFMPERDYENGDEIWNDSSARIGKQLIAAVVEIFESLRKMQDKSPPPSWALESNYRLAEELRIESEISRASEQVTRLQSNLVELNNDLCDSIVLRGLLYEQGHALEHAVLEALELFGFKADRVAESDSEFDAVFTSPEGRCLGEAEGKDRSAINIEKHTQLERNINEDFQRDEVATAAKGVLFGNAHRFLPLNERKEHFTAKCLSAAKRVGTALVITSDMFEPARYLKEHPEDQEYATACRKVIFDTNGEIVKFPTLPKLNPKL